MFSNPDFLRHVAGEPIPAEEVWARILRHIGHWSVFGFGLWAVEEKATGRFAGEVGIANFNREIDHLFNDAPEAVWGLVPWSHGKGFATEAVSAVHTWFDGQFGPTRTVCIVRPANAASIRVAAKNGYREVRRPSTAARPCSFSNGLRGKAEPAP